MIFYVILLVGTGEPLPYCNKNTLGKIESKFGMLGQKTKFFDRFNLKAPLTHANVLPGSILTIEDTAQTVLVYPCDRLIYIGGFALNKKRKKGMLLLLLWVYKGLG